MPVDRDHVLRRLCDARDWAQYVHDTLTLDEAHEAGKQRVLEGMTAPEELRALQAESRALADRLRLLADRFLSVQVG
jgi:hypothetical protein